MEHVVNLDFSESGPAEALHWSSVLQIRRGKRDNLGIIFHITPLKHNVATPH